MLFCYINTPFMSLLLAASIAITFVAGANIYIGTEYDGDECMGHETELWYDVDQNVQSYAGSVVSFRSAVDATVTFAPVDCGGRTKSVNAQNDCLNSNTTGQAWGPLHYVCSVKFHQKGKPPGNGEVREAAEGKNGQVADRWSSDRARAACMAVVLLWSRQ